MPMDLNVTEYEKSLFHVVSDSILQLTFKKQLIEFDVVSKNSSYNDLKRLLKDSPFSQLYSCMRLDLFHRLS